MEDMSSFRQVFTQRDTLVSELQKAKKQFINYNVQECGGDEGIIHFISNILFHGTNGISINDSVETVRSLFEAGYCYYFAKMLEDAFPGGVICVCYPYGHIVYVFEEVAYDICGVTDAEFKYLLPLSEFGECVDTFKHISGKYCQYSKDYLEQIANKCVEEHKDLWALVECNACKDVVKHCEGVMADKVSAEYQEDKQKLYDFLERLAITYRDGSITLSEFRQRRIQYCRENGLSWYLLRRIRRRDKDIL